MLSFLKEEGVSSELLEKLAQFRTDNPTELPERVPVPQFHYYGREVWEQAIAALLCGKNLLLTGGKATGKNVLAENLAAVFGRPAWNVSFHVNLDASGLVGTDTFTEGQVGILDEINMAKNEALAVLHAVLDFRRVLDIPGYDRLPMAPAARFIATMNYGYAGTRELNEALASRFVVIQMPAISPENLDRLLKHRCPELKQKYRQQFVSLFFDLQKKCEGGEISSKALDLRGLLDALELMAAGVPSGPALDMGITNKTADGYEQGLIRDVMAARVSPKLTRGELFGP